jgi:hypothetical protein
MKMCEIFEATESVCDGSALGILRTLGIAHMLNAKFNDSSTRMGSMMLQKGLYSCVHRYLRHRFHDASVSLLAREIDALVVTSFTTSPFSRQ